MIELLLGYIFYIAHSFVKKRNCENFWIKSLLLTIEQFFFRNSKLRNGSRHQRFLKLESVKSIKTAALFSFVIILNIMVKTFFQEQRCFI